MPNRKIRNQPSSRVHDIEFAAEISTSLIAQVRNLQALLAERDEEVKDLKASNSGLEIESENLQQRLKTLDESEHRYKEANWELETRIQDLNATQREQADREKKLTQNLDASTLEKSAAQKELDEVKLAHAKLSEEHAAVIKHHDIELGTAKRNLVMADGERATMQRKIDDLTNQNTELAKAFSTQRGRSQARDPASGLSDEDFETATDNITPEHSPPPSPIKGTPRHSMLETETMKTSLHHAQRTIQSQRGQIHREKTEKLELRRIIQDLKDDLERARNDSGGSAANRRSRKVDSKEFKKGKSLLGSFRSSRQEILEDDPEWEDHQNQSPRNSSPNVNPIARQAGDSSFATDTSEHFDTANEASESAFETANERATETEDFQTGNEDLGSDSDGAETETETTSRGFGRMKRPPSLPAGLATSGHRNSFHSTASTSADEEDLPELKTPTATISSQRSRARLSRGLLSRSSRQASEEPNLASSPASFATSISSTPKAGGQSLFAELQDEFGSDDESLGVNTPSRRSTRSITPGSTRRPLSPPPALPSLPKVLMVDSSTMTDDVEISATRPETPIPVAVAGEELDRPRTMQSIVENRDSMLSVDVPGAKRPLSTSSYSDAGAQHDVEMEEKLAMFPVPPTTPPRLDITTVELSMSTIKAENIQPLQERQQQPVSPSLTFTPIAAERIEPLEPERVAPAPQPSLSLTPLLIERIEPGRDLTIPAPPLTLSRISAENAIAPTHLEIPRPLFSFTGLSSESVLPVPDAEAEHLPAPVPATFDVPELVFSAISAEDLQPIQEPEMMQPQAPFAYSALTMEHTAPIQEPARTRAHNVLTYSPLSAQNVQPVSEPVPARPKFSLSTISSENVAPVLRNQPPLPVLALSPINGEDIEPISGPAPARPRFALSSISSENIAPVNRQEPSPPALSLSPITTEHVVPVNPADNLLAPYAFGFSAIGSIETRPVSPRSPRRDGFILPRDADSPDSKPETPKNKGIGALLGWNKNGDSSPLIAEDDTRQSPRDTPEAETPESQRPFKELSSNSNARPPRKTGASTSDQGAQTALTADALDKLFTARSRPSIGHEKKLSASSFGSIGSSGTVRITREPHEGVGSPLRNKTRIVEDHAAESSSLRRPGSAGSGRTSLLDAPPLPSNHREIIEAARSGSANGPHNSMGPPLWPASALKNRPRTPSGAARPLSSQSGRGTPTPRAVRTGSVSGAADVQQRARSAARSRQSSVSSFASELDGRFNMRVGEMGMDPSGFGANTDPRMIQAITQTMIGEYLWKYTRKTGRGEMSEKRHRRYFWVHPYTRALYWSDSDPSTAGRTAELKAKSVPIEAVRVVTDDNPMPPGLHRKSLIVVAPGRTIKFTCQTGQRHETWFNALSYLLLRTNDAQTAAEEVATGITREDVDEFNPQISQQPGNGTRAQAAPSLSSYNSRTTHNESPLADHMEIPTLTPSGRHRGTSSQRPSMGTLGRLSGYWKSGGPKISGTFSSLRGRGPSAQSTSIYEASEVHDSAEDLREMIERQDRESDRLENVRACCDGKIYLIIRRQQSDVLIN